MSTIELLSIEEASAFNNNKDFLVLKIRDKNYKLHNYKFFDNYLEGDLYTKTKNYGNYILVTADVDDEITIARKTSTHIKIQNENIKKITYSKTNESGLIVFTGILFGLLILSNLEIGGNVAPFPGK